MKQQLSAWHPPNVKPVHIGVYRVHSNKRYSWWNGTWWELRSNSAFNAEMLQRVRDKFQGNNWRGIVQNPDIAKMEARAAGLRTFQGSKCKHGHDGIRYTSTGQCVSCMKIYNTFTRHITEKGQMK